VELQDLNGLSFALIKLRPATVNIMVICYRVARLVAEFARWSTLGDTSTKRWRPASLETDALEQDHIFELARLRDFLSRKGIKLRVDGKIGGYRVSLKAVGLRDDETGEALA
jgi:hypothetical protein